MTDLNNLIKIVVYIIPVSAICSFQTCIIIAVYYIPLEILTITVVYKNMYKEIWCELYRVTFSMAAMPSILKFFGRAPSWNSSIVRKHRQDVLVMVIVQKLWTSNKCDATIMPFLAKIPLFGHITFYRKSMGK